MVPKFYGDGGDNELEKIFQKKRINEDQKLMEAVRGLKGSAFNWYQGWRWINLNASWRNFEKTLIEKYLPEIYLVDNAESETSDALEEKEDANEETTSAKEEEKEIAEKEEVQKDEEKSEEEEKEDEEQPKKAEEKEIKTEELEKEEDAEKENTSKEEKEEEDAAEPKKGERKNNEEIRAEIWLHRVDSMEEVRSLAQRVDEKELVAGKKTTSLGKSGFPGNGPNLGQHSRAALTTRSNKLIGETNWGGAESANGPHKEGPIQITSSEPKGCRHSPTKAT